MIDIDLSAMKQRLVERREVLITDQVAIFRDCQSISQQDAADEADRASAACDFAVAVNAANIESQEIEAIDAALLRIENGKYGDCEGCQNGIPNPRLQVLPDARFCVGCQEAYESHGLLDEILS